MIGGLFIYNHKGEVLISRVYRDDIGYVLNANYSSGTFSAHTLCCHTWLVSEPSKEYA